MPCNTVVTSKVEILARSTDPALLGLAFDALGVARTSWTFNKETGDLSMPRYIAIDEVKRAYSEQVVISQARKFGWQLSWKTNSSGNREARVVKRA